MAKPTFIPPMLATLVAAPFDDPDWLFEVKWDGFRVEAVVDGGRVQLWTRGEQDAAEWYFGPFLDPPTWIAAKDAIVDGEVIALDERGEPDFALLQARIKGRASGRRADAVRLRGLRPAPPRRPLAPRRAARGAPAAARARPARRIRGSGSANTSRAEAWRSSRRPGCAASKGSWPRTAARRTCPGKRSDRWQKVKIRPEQELVVGGWAQGTGRAVDLGALLVGVYEGGGLRYAGKIGAGFTDGSRAELLAAVAPARRGDVAVRGTVPRAAARDAKWLRRSSSSAPSSRAGRATASSARPRTRASSPRRTPARSSASARRPDRRQGWLNPSIHE